MTYEELRREMEGQREEMTYSERRAEYARGNLVDHQPFSLMSADPAMAAIFGYSQKEYRESLDVQKEVIRRKEKEFGLEGIYAGMGLKGIGRAVGSRIVYPDDQIEYVSECVLENYRDLHSYDLIKPREIPFMMDRIERTHRLKEAFPHMRVRTSVAGPMTTAISIRKVEDVMRDLLRDPEELHYLLSYAVDCSLEWVKTMAEEFDGVQCTFADPASSQNLLSVRHFRLFSRPHMERLIEGIEKITGSRPGVHICGKTRRIWEDLREMGIASFSVDDCEDVGGLKQVMGTAMPISGNVPPVTVLCNGTIDEVIESVRTCLEKASDSQCGYTVDSGCQIPIGTPRKNVEAYIYAVRKYGKGARKGKKCQGLELRDAF